jgi:hypothetical protein
VELVLKNGVVYEPAALIDSVRASIGAEDGLWFARWPWSFAIGAACAALFVAVAYAMRSRSKSRTAA